jgi:phospholysine phosphohistidine inorganic pyrophosphate phosphatase
MGQDSVRAYLLDLDGTLYVGDAPLPGAVEAIARLVNRNVPRRYLTNTTRVSRQELALRLQRMGFAIRVEEIFTAPRAAAAWLIDRQVRQISLYLPAATREDFQGFSLTDVSPEAIVVGDLGAGWSFERLNQAFRQLLEGARLVALQKNRYWRTGDGLTLDAGPFVAALEYAARVQAVVVGKPAPDFFRLAAASMDVAPDGVTVVGDDLEGDIGGAQGAGMRGVLVRTGKFRAEDLARSQVRPDAIAATLMEATEE